jgi:hypothetical protein
MIIAQMAKLFLYKNCDQYYGKKMYATPSATLRHLSTDSKARDRKMLAPQIMLTDLLTQKCVHKKKVTDFGYPRTCRFRKIKFYIGRRSSLYQLKTNVI